MSRVTTREIAIEMSHQDDLTSSGRDWKVIESGFESVRAARTSVRAIKADDRRLGWKTSRWQYRIVHRTQTTTIKVLR